MRVQLCHQKLRMASANTYREYLLSRIYREHTNGKEKREIQIVIEGLKHNRVSFYTVKARPRESSPVDRSKAISILFYSDKFPKIYF